MRSAARAAAARAATAIADRASRPREGRYIAYAIGEILEADRTVAERSALPSVCVGCDRRVRGSAVPEKELCGSGPARLSPSGRVRDPRRLLAGSIAALAGGCLGREATPRQSQ